MSLFVLLHVCTKLSNVFIKWNTLGQYLYTWDIDFIGANSCNGIWTNLFTLYRSIVKWNDSVLGGHFGTDFCWAALDFKQYCSVTGTLLFCVLPVHFTVHITYQFSLVALVYSWYYILCSILWPQNSCL